MTSQDHPRGSREAYERLSDPAMYWTSVNAQPIREPILRSERPEEPRRDPLREPALSWEPEPAQEETGLTDLIPYADEEPAYDDRPAYRPPARPAETYRSSRSSYDDEEELEAHERFGGVNWGAGFFGWLVTVGFGMFLASLLGVVFTVLQRLAPSVASIVDPSSTTGALAVGAAGFAVLMLASYVGGYVAGRMSRFDGGRQGAGVWVTGILLTMFAVGLALFFGSTYHLSDHVSLPPVHVPAGATGLMGLVAAVVTGIGSLLAAVGGGKVGCRYHEKVDEYL